MNLDRELYGFTGFTVAWALLALLAFGGLNVLHVPTVDFVSWAIAAAIFWWLIIITTVPWNIYFRARAVLADAAESRRREIDVDEQACQYVTVIQRRVLGVAIALHGMSAISLYLLAVAGISTVGYLGSIAALLLTGLRPTIAAYRFLMQRLASIGKGLVYPRHDIVTFQHKVQQLCSQQEALTRQLDPDDDSSWVAQQQRTLARFQDETAQLRAAHDHLKASNAEAHQHITLEARSAIAQLNEDSEFLDRVRELIRFWKTA